LFFTFYYLLLVTDVLRTIQNNLENNHEEEIIDEHYMLNYIYNNFNTERFLYTFNKLFTIKSINRLLQEYMKLIMKSDKFSDKLCKDVYKSLIRKYNKYPMNNQRFLICKKIFFTSFYSVLTFNVSTLLYDSISYFIDLFYYDDVYNNNNNNNNITNTTTSSYSIINYTKIIEKTQRFVWFLAKRVFSDTCRIIMSSLGYSIGSYFVIYGGGSTISFLFEGVYSIFIAPYIC